MGRKRWWKGSLELLVLCFLQSLVHADGEIGCLFSKNVCRSGVETCYDDAAFGRCVQAFGELGDEDLYRYDLDARELELLRRQLKSLVVDGYEWIHPYTQCVMQSSLYSLRYKLKRESEFCQELRTIKESSLNEYRDDEEPDPVDSQPLAVVNFAPIRGHGYGDFANEKYYPPVSSKKPNYHNSHHPEKNEPENDYTYAYSSFRKNPKNHRISKFEDNMKDSQNNEDVLLMEKPNDSLNVDANFDDLSKNFRELSQRLNVKYEEPIYRLRRQPTRWTDNAMIGSISLRTETPNKVEMKDITMSDNGDKLKKMGESRSWKNVKLDKNIWNLMRMNNSVKRNEDPLGIKSLSKDEPLHFFLNSGRQDSSTSLDNDGAENEEEENREENERLIINRTDDDDDDDDEEFEQNDNEEAVLRVEESLNRLNNRRKTSGMYTEGGFVQPMDIDDVMRQGPDDIILDDDDINKLVWSRNLAAFQRPERVDVKKPGPLYSTNNYAFKTQLPPDPIGTEEEQSLVNDMSLENYDEKVVRSPHAKKTYSEVNYNGQIYENVDTDHLYIQFNNEFTKWSDGEKVVEEVAKLLDMSPDSFSDIRVGRAEVTFRVTSEPNNAIAIAPKIAGIREQLEKVTGMEVVRAGIGDKVKLPPTLNVEIAPKPMSPGLFGAAVAAGGAAAAAAAIVILVIARKHAKSRAKLAGLATPDPEASKDYQDLCRARMQAKQPNENKPESPRIINLSRESESNRSSTSSWGEEAAALTNMDIATGHMVLTYMEDHLKNKDRLDQEWAGICAYEADPSSVRIATEKTNADRNRPGSSLPYDHSRVVLNDLSNANNSDYINASTITDHDPRNPAYIATQGPLPQTSADFWQLVWEQGSVVIVMLTRLTEEGRGMCHRYWPEEGSELYHIYEVHLVSEHIWCDDYLVRSFYLKNLRTGETRTVTQFHFLSWPENGVPQSTKALLEFRRKVNKSYRGRSCPIVVHCSDGAGRTGTYCLIDMVLNRMAKGAKEIDIAAALEHIRDQRPGMVAMKQQFEFVLVAVAEEVHAILKALPVQTLTEKSQISNVVVTPASASQSSSGSDQ